MRIMSVYETSCFRVSDIKICVSCKSDKIIKNGFTKNQKQQYYCKECHKRFIDFYTYKAYHCGVNKYIVSLTKKGMGVRSTARFLEISTTTLLKRILLIAKNIKPPMVPTNKEYEVDELCTYVGNKSKRVWLVCALEKENRKIVRFNIGRRNKQTMKQVTDILHFSYAKKVFTDQLPSYKKLIENKIHQVTRYGTNRLERFHLTLRTHLKRLNRKTICFSKSIVMLAAVLKIYLWL